MAGPAREHSGAPAHSPEIPMPRFLRTRPAAPCLDDAARLLPGGTVVVSGGRTGAAVLTPHHPVRP